MQIGFPTDVKHVAHIGGDGPSVNSPGWMNEFKPPPSSPGFSSTPLNRGGGGEIKEETPVKLVYEGRVVCHVLDTSRRSARATPNSPARDIPDLPKSSRRRSSTETASAAASGVDSPTKAKADKARQSRRSSKNSAKDLLDPTKSGQGIDSPSRTLPDVPKKTRRKNSKESSDNGRTNRSSRSKAQAAELDNGSESDPVGKTNSNSEHCHASALSALEEVEQGFTGIS
ncbi:CRIB domain-containing protein RIC6-like [Tripterygium wilfordii]|uniref:CRIB domain-containing protein RIC6-like n=1 Tax=Tripterygium wilfordii TaxID=458696 RepID=UPI0018F7F5C8|nr:CRIB domain-containing protein RIC6-like [Tripterygium wilfordii]